MKHKSQVYLSHESNRVDDAKCDIEQDDVRSNTDKAGCVEKDDSSYASYPRCSINATSEFHFEFKQSTAGSVGSRNTSNNPNPSSAAAVCDYDYSSSGAEVTKILGDTSHATRTRAQSETNITPRLESDSSVAVSSSLTQDTSQSASPSDKFSDKYSSDKKGADARAEVVPEMKTNDLNPSLNFPGENDLSNLPFSMPKLERR